MNPVVAVAIGVSIAGVIAIIASLVFYFAY